MKKIIATVLATVMILSILATLAIVPATAAEDKDTGDWAVYADPGAYKDEGKEPLYVFDDPTTSEMDIPSYEYTDKGFKVSGTYATEPADTKPRFQITTKEKQNLKKGVSLTVELDGYAEGSHDRWVSFYIWDQPNPSQGNNTGKYGNGYACLNRFTIIQNFISSQGFYDGYNLMAQPGSETNPCTWNMLDADVYGPTGEPVGVAHNTTSVEGVYTLTMDLVYDEGTNFYSLYIQDKQVGPAQTVNEFFQIQFPDGYGYVGFGLFNAVSNCTTTAVITEFNGEKPTGTDKADQLYNAEPLGPMIDTSTLDPEAPVLLFDAHNAKGEFERTGYLPISDGTNIANKYDGSFRIYPKDSDHDTYFSMSPDNDWTYEASDYPYAVALFRNYCNCIVEGDEDFECEGRAGHTVKSVYYCAGKNSSPDGNYRLEEWPQEEEYEDFYGNKYQLFMFDFSDFGEDWSGRINTFRLDVRYTDKMLSDEDTNHFDLCYMAYFQTAEAAKAYAEKYVNDYEPCPHEGEKIVTPEIPATCTSAGKRETEQCADCYEYTKGKAPKVIPALNHDWQSSEYIAPTCTEDGREAGRACARCGANESKVIEALGHVEIYKSDEENHWIGCQNCDYAETPEAHNIGDNDVCTVCGHGCPHTDTTWNTTTVATCSTPGLKSETCNECGATVNSEVIAALGHTEEVLPAVEPTCEEAGRTEGKKCSVCNTVTVTQTVVPAKGHTEEEIPAVDATCTETGLTAGKKCTVCGAVTVEQTETPVAAHTYDNDTDTDCNVCGAKRTINTQPPATNTPSEGGDDNSGDDGEKKGCGSVIGLGAFAVIATVALAGAVSLKKKD